MFLQRADVGEDPLEVFAPAAGDADAFVAAMLEQAPHLEVDAASLRMLPIEDREPFAVAVTRVLDGVLVDALSPAQRFNLTKWSRVLEAGTLESSDEDDVDGTAQGYDVLSDSTVAIRAVDEDILDHRVKARQAVLG